MPLISQYAHLQKKASDEGRWVTFTPLRAVGLAVEKGHKEAKAKGLGRVTTDSLSTVSVSGSAVQVLEGRRWRRVTQCQLQLSSAEATLSLAIVQKQRRLLNNLQINAWEVDLRMPRRLGSYDLLGDFSGPQNHGVTGRLWIELKVISGRGYDTKLHKIQEDVEQQLRNVSDADPTVEAALLIATKAQRDGRAWHTPKLASFLALASGGGWQPLSGMSVPVRGRANPSTKPGLQEVWNGMEWSAHPHTQEKVGFVKHFLKALKLPRTSLGKRSKAFNKLLANAGVDGRLERVSMPSKAGSRPWVASKDVFRCLYYGL